MCDVWVWVLSVCCVVGMVHLYLLYNIFYTIPGCKYKAPYGMVWCGVVWCGVVWCGVVWCGMVWYGMDSYFTWGSL